MKTTDNFSRRFLSICAGVSLVLISAAAFVYSAKPSLAGVNKATKSIIQTGTNENFIPLGIENGVAYWIVYNTTEGYKFRKSSVSNPKWQEK
jgi:hypothetical protein